MDIIKMPFPATPDDVTADWLSEILGAPVTRVDWRPIGTGQIADSVRFSIAYAQPGAGPETLACKFAAADPSSRKTAMEHRLYVKEVVFYREFADRLRLRVPKTVAAEVSEDGSACILLFEDLAPARQGDQLAGCELSDAIQAVVQLAGLHAPSWDNPAFLERPCLLSRPAGQDAFAETYRLGTRIFAERYADQLEPELMAVCHGLAEKCKAWQSRDYAHRSLVHGDYRLDNMLFDILGGTERIAILDWQTLQVGSGLTDLAYFLGAGVGTTLAAQEDELVACYFSAMQHAGCPLDRERVWDDYRVGALHGVMTAVFSAAFVERTERGDAMFLDMARGACQLALKHNSMGLL